MQDTTTTTTTNKLVFDGWHAMSSLSDVRILDGRSLHYGIPLERWCMVYFLSDRDDAIIVNVHRNLPGHNDDGFWFFQSFVVVLSF